MEVTKISKSQDSLEPRDKLESDIITSIQKRGEDLGYPQEMTELAIDLAIALHRGGYKELRGKRGKKIW
jgi:hypothetical protein